jgi:mannose-6-phosphate isomerase class I
LGNVLYEIQKDVMDPVCTIRSFDKGKFKSDGSIREIHIDDYFKYLDTNPDHNDVEKMTPKRQGNSLIKTSDYSLDILEVEGEIKDETKGSYSHIFVRDGKVEVEAEEGKVTLTSGHSCFIPEDVLTYGIRSIGGPAVVLKGYVENE